MRRSTTRLVVLIILAGVFVALAPGFEPALAGGLEKSVQGRWRGAWVLTSLDTYSDCAGTHTNNAVSGTLVNSRGRLRFRPGELMVVQKVDLKRSRVDLILGVPEPILTSYKDGPFTLYNETRCGVELNVELPRSVVSDDDVNGIDNVVRQVITRFNSQDEAMQAKMYNRRQREAYPPDYEITLARHAAWKAQQTNAAIQARIDKALVETARLTDRIQSEPDYLKGFAAGVQAMKTIDLSQCGELMARDIVNVPSPSAQLAGAFIGEAAGRYTRGYQDGQRLVLGVESLRVLPACMVPVPPVPQDQMRPPGR